MKPGARLSAFAAVGARVVTVSSALRMRRSVSIGLGVVVITWRG